MGFLYPRLLADQAKPLHEAYRALKIPELTKRVATAHDSAVYVATGGDRVTEDRLRELRRMVVDLAEEAGFPNESNRDMRAAFDLRVAAALHEQMGIVPAEAASGDVWAFLALVLLPDVAYWRYPMPPVDRVLGTDLTRHVFGRMWWRARLVRSSDDPDPYAALNILGEAAFDQIYARRKALGGSPHLVKAILRTWNSLDLHGVDEREALRDFLKRLLRLAPFVLFESLDDETLDSELRIAARESIIALLGTTSISADELQAKVDAVFAGSSDTSADVAARTTERRRENGTFAAPSSALGTNTPSSDERHAVAGAHETAPGIAPKSEPAPYAPYTGSGFGDPCELGLGERADAVRAIVAMEGPVKALRVYRLIAELSGRELDDAARSALIGATRYAARTGLIEVDGRLDRTGPLVATLRTPEQPSYVLRTCGPRDVDEIPSRELVAAAGLVRTDGSTPDPDTLVVKAARLMGYEASVESFREALIDALKDPAE